MWLGGRTGTQIAAACGITLNYVGVIVHALRAEGIYLPRRRRPVRPGRARPVRMSRPDKLAPDRDDILDAWCDGMQARDIALLTRRSLGSVKEIVRRARLASDPRATRHSRWPKPSVVVAAA